MKVGARKKEKTKTETAPRSARVILADIRSSHNVGSMFRTADALGIENIYLAGYTPAPKDAFGRVNKELAKVALGGEETVVWESHKDIFLLLRRLKKEGFTLVAVEQDEHAIDYKKFKYREPAVFIFGNEVDGLPKKVISLCDEIVEIPMKGKKESLNVSVSFGIALSRILNL